MRVGLLLPVLMLIGAVFGLVLTSFAARRRGLIERRLEAAVGGAPDSHVAGRQALSIRLRQPGSPKLHRAARLLHIPMDLPLAHVVPPWAILSVGTGLALATVWFGHFGLSWVLSALAGVFVWIVVVRGVFGWEMARYQGKLVRQLPDTVQLVVSATRAGLPVAEAFKTIAAESVSPTREEFRRVEREMALGGAPDEALLSLHERTGVPEYAILAVTIGVQMRSGGRLVETIENLAETVRDRLSIAARARALAGEAKLSASIMCVLPVLGALMMSVLKPGQIDILFTDPRGIRMFTFGVGTLVLGIVTMRQLIRGATRD
jgi:tight adherence protein B